jgi:hypothetical protein
MLEIRLLRQFDVRRDGTPVDTLENGEVGISPFHNLDALVSAKVKADLEQIVADIRAGKIKTRP